MIETVLNPLLHQMNVEEVAEDSYSCSSVAPSSSSSGEGDSGDDDVILFLLAPHLLPLFLLRIGIQILNPEKLS